MEKKKSGTVIWKKVSGESADLRLFGFDISVSRGKSADSGALSREASGQGLYTPMFSNWVIRKVQPSLYEALREAIPVVDVALHRLVSLDGLLRFDGANKGLVHEIEDWAHAVRVNDMQTGLQAFVNNFSNETYEQGFSISEFISSPGRDDIVRLNVADSKDILFRRAPGGLEIWYRGRSNPKKSRNATEQVGDILQDNLSAAEASARLSSTGYEKLGGANTLYYSIDNENHGPYGVSLLRSTEFVSKILLTIQNATLNAWERFGDPSYHISYKTSKRELGAGTLEDRRKELAKNFNQAVTDKRQGRSADFVTAIDKDSDVAIKIIGAEGQLLELETPARHVLEQLTARFHMPPWLLGFHWSTTERLAQYESEILLQEAETRGENKLPSVKRIVETMLRMRGRKWKRGDWEVYFELPNLHDLVAQAQARFLNAQADMYYMQGNRADQVLGNQEPVKRVKRAHSGGCCTATKESRPVASPELDRVEEEFEASLKGKWAGLKTKVLSILKLREPGKSVKGPDDLPDSDKFNFTPEQRAQVMKAMKDWIGEWQPGADDAKALEWYYGQSYSLGLIQAARMIGKDRPMLDIVKNREIYKDLVDNGFALVKDGATRAIVNGILPEMEAQMLSGTNPRHVANRLAGLFDDANSNWERLARSEMAMSAERAKLDEAAANGIKRMEFVAAGDACPICLALAGQYDIEDTPVPVRDTHPRCYCTTIPIVE